MSERMLVTQALDERDLLVKKINDKIIKAHFVDTIKPNEKNVYSGNISWEEFEQNAKSAFQQITDLCTRYEKIDAAIIASNACTKIVTSYGEFTVAAAIALRNRLKASKSDTNFELKLKKKMQEDYHEQVQMCDYRNSQLQEAAKQMRHTILGKDSKAKEDKPLSVVDEYVKENTTELVNPLDIKTKIDALEEKHNTLLTELDTQIKVSNATTFIEIE